MTTSHRRKITDKPRPNDFRESLSPVLPSVPLFPLGSSVLPSSFTRYGLIVLWVLAVLMAGVGIGLAMIARGMDQSSAPPHPVATQSVAVQPVADLSLTQSAAPSTAPLSVAPAQSVDQSTVGDISQVASAPVYQSATGSQQLSPEFNSYGLVQGGNGTDPVRR